jgi:hypothetical protein
MNQVNFTAGFSLSEYKDYYFFVNDSSDISRLNIVYDSKGTSLMNIYGELIYSKLKYFHFSIRGDYFDYKNQIIEESWHRPKYKVAVNMDYNVVNKMVFGVQAYFIGGIPYYDWNSDSSGILDPVMDVNLKTSYKFSERLGFFIHFNNILGNQYERYWRYPSRGIQVIGGVSVNF